MSSSQRVCGLRLAPVRSPTSQYSWIHVDDFPFWLRYAEAILALRTYAFLGRTRGIAILLIIMLLIETGYLLYVAIDGVHQTPMLYGTIGPCTASDAPGRHVVTGFWLCPVVFDLICTGLTAIKVSGFRVSFVSVSYLIHICTQAFRLHNLGMRSGIVKTFVTEGLFYFLVSLS